MSLNRIVLIGRLTRDPEMNYTPQGVAVTKMSIAVDRFSKNDQGEYETDFFNIVAFRRTAEFASNYLTKGRLVGIEGRLQNRSWIDQASGQKRTMSEIIADNVQGLDRRQDAPGMDHGDNMGLEDIAPAAPPPMAAAAPAPARSTATPATRATRTPPPPPVDDDMDEADPFADE